MRLDAARPSLYRQPAQLGGLKKILRKAAGPVLAVAAVASGQPQLAVPAFQAGKAATRKRSKLQAPVEPLPPPSWWDTLTAGDRNALVIGGAVLGSLVLFKALTGGRR